MMSPTRIVHPTAVLAPRALLPGDPGRALLLAQYLMADPKMFNHNRGLWGYTGRAADGEPLTIMSHGLGGPSAVAVLDELADLGLRTAVRIGTCSALEHGPAPGDLLAVTHAIPRDGTSAALGAHAPLEPDAVILAALREEADAAGIVLSSDLFHAPEEPHPDIDGAVAVDLSTAAVFAAAQQRSVRIGCVLLVRERGRDGSDALDAPTVEAGGERLGNAGFAALLAAGV